MTKEEYLNELKKRLSNYSKMTREDIVESFEEHFNDGINAGQSEEEIISELGSIDEVMKNIGEMADMEEEFKQQNHSYKEADADFSASMNQLAHSIKDTVKAAVKSFGAHVDKEYAEAFDIDAKNAEQGVLEGYEDTDTLMIRAEKAGLKVYLGQAKEMDYSYADPSGKNILQAAKSEKNAVFFVEGDSSVPVRKSAVLKIDVPSNIQNIQFDIPAGKITINDQDIEEIAGSLVSCDFEANNIHGKRMIVKSVSGDISGEECFLEEISFTSKSGDISLENAEGTLLCNTVSGDVDLSNLKGDADIKAVSGDIDINDHACNTVSVVSTSGDIDAEEIAHCEAVYLKSVSGDIECMLADTDFTAAIKTISGDFNSSLNYSKVGRGLYQSGNGSASVELTTVSGDVSLKV